MFGRMKLNARGTIFLYTGVLLAALLGGCSGDDSSGGGGSKSPGSRFKAAPSARPSLNGQNVRIDVSGGTATAGNGESGGSVEFEVFQGRLVTGGGGSRGSINQNFLASALADNTVTYAELIAIDPAITDVSGGAATIYLSGWDFFLPSGATLDLTATPGAINDVRIITSGPTDYIRIDGTVNGVRAASNSVNLGLTSLFASGPAITIDGTVTLNSTAALGAGSLAAGAHRGSVMVGGTISAIGASGASPTGGGGVYLRSHGDLFVAAGIIQANGGGGSNSGASGGQFTLTGNTTQTGVHSVRWGVRMNGGNGTANNGGHGGSVDFEISGIADFFTAIEANGGTSPSGAFTGGSGGSIELIRGVANGVVSAVLNGGTGGTGGGGGEVECEPRELYSFALVVVANGGTGSTGAGGQGGECQINNEGAFFEQVVIDVTQNGGNGVTSGGTGGELDIDAAAYFAFVSVIADLNGGDASNGSGGTSGELVIENGGAQNFAPARKITINASLNGGHATGANGNGGNVDSTNCYILFYGNASEVDISITAVGGDGSTTGNGGGSGYFGIYATGDVVKSRVYALLTGGEGVNGGNGTVFDFEITGNLIDSKFEVSNSGGNGSTGSGGSSSIVYFYVGYHFSGSGDSYGDMVNTTLDFTCNGGSGASGGSSTSFQAYIYGRTIKSRLDIEYNGGLGTSTNGGGTGQIFYYSFSDILDFVINAQANAGNGPDMGGTASSLYVYGFALVDKLNVNYSAIGGNATTSATGTAGNGGTLFLFSGYTSGGDLLDSRITTNLSGGNAVLGTSGGMGGIHYGFHYGNVVDTTFSFTGNGGTAAAANATAGDGGQMLGYFGYAGEGGVAINTTVTLALNGGAATGLGTSNGGNAGFVRFEQYDHGHSKFAFNGTLNGGSGNDAGGNGGSIDLAGDSSLVTVEGTFNNVQANGGNATAGEGGIGGILQVTPNGVGTSTGSGIVRGSFTARGGNSAGAGNDGGQGGSAQFACGTFGTFVSENLTLDMRGGDSASADGGDGGNNFSGAQASNAIHGAFYGPATIGGTFNVSGGNGGTAGVTGIGGDGGSVELEAYGAGIIVSANITSNGGNGATGGGNGCYRLTVRGDTGGVGGYLEVTGNLTSIGGNATVNGDGGGGAEYIYIPNIGTGVEATSVRISGTMNASGGNGAGGGNGGHGGGLQFDSRHVGIMSGSMIANGGTGAMGGLGGLVYSDGSDAQVLSITGTIRVNGGVGTTNGGNGGIVDLDDDMSTVFTISGTIEANGAAGGSGGNGGNIAIGGGDAVSATFTSSARVRANGGSTSGAAGFININLAGSGGAGITEQAGSVLQTNTGAGVAMPANIDRNS